MTQDTQTVEEKQFCDCYDHDFRRALVQMEKLLSLQPITEQSIDTARMYVIHAHEINTQKRMRHLEETIKAMEAHGNARYEEGVKAERERMAVWAKEHSKFADAQPVKDDSDARWEIHYAGYREAIGNLIAHLSDK